MPFGKAAEAKRTTKSEVLSMRLDPKTRFIVEIIARYRGQSISTVVERALLEAAESVRIHTDGGAKTWRDYWDVSEGVRALRIAADSELYPTFEEERRLAFTRAHSPFFYRNADYSRIKMAFVDILWPSIDDFVELWEQTKATDRWVAGKAMREVLVGAGIEDPPDWPSKQPAPSKVQEPEDVQGDLAEPMTAARVLLDKLKAGKL
jgi:hypothetical protein